MFHQAPLKKVQVDDHRPLYLPFGAIFSLCPKVQLDDHASVSPFLRHLLSLSLGPEHQSKLIREFRLEQERQMMNDLEHGEVVKAHMDVPLRQRAPASQPPKPAQRNPAKDHFDPIKAGKLPRILGGRKKELDYGNDDTDLHGFVGPEKVYFYNHEEDPLPQDQALKARKEIKRLRKIEAEEKNDDAEKPEAVDEPGFHGFVGPDKVYEYEHGDRLLNKGRGAGRRSQTRKAKREFLNMRKPRDYDGRHVNEGGATNRSSLSGGLPGVDKNSAGANRFFVVKEDWCSKCKVYNLSLPIDGDFDCIAMAMKPNTPVCLYSDKEDTHISRTLRRERMWEPHIVKEVQNILSTDPDLGVIDLGANIGVYSLISAKMGHKVVAVEPHLDNIRRLHKALELGNLKDKITILQNAVSDHRQIMVLKYSGPNMGGLFLGSANGPCPSSTCAGKVQTILIDDLLGVVPFKKALMKVDIEGFEHRAFRRASGLLDKVYVPFIVMEWKKLREYFGSKITDTTDKSLVWDLVKLLTSRGYKAYSLVTGIRLNIKYWYGWPDDIIWKNELQELF